MPHFLSESGTLSSCKWPTFHIREPRFGSQEAISCPSGSGTLSGGTGRAQASVRKSWRRPVRRVASGAARRTSPRRWPAPEPMAVFEVLAVDRTEAGGGEGGVVGAGVAVGLRAGGVSEQWAGFCPPSWWAGRQACPPRRVRSPFSNGLVPAQSCAGSPTGTQLLSSTWTVFRLRSLAVLFPVRGRAGEGGAFDGGGARLRPRWCEGLFRAWQAGAVSCIFGP